jgi:hypothetical protein
MKIQHEDHKVQTMKDHITSIWEGLQTEFGNKVPLALESGSGLAIRYLTSNPAVTVVDLAEINQLQIDREDYVSIELNLVPIIQECIRMFDTRLMATSSNLHFDAEDNKLVIRDIWVGMREESFLRLLILNIDNIVALKEYFRVILRHEMGHVLSILEVPDKFTNPTDYQAYVDRFQQQENALRQEYGVSTDPEDNLTFFQTLPREIDANDRVGLTGNDIIKAEKSIVNVI